MCRAIAYVVAGGTYVRNSSPILMSNSRIGTQIGLIVWFSQSVLTLESVSADDRD